MLQTSALQPGQELARPERVGPLGSQGHGGCAGWCVDFATLSSFSCVNIGCCSICCCIYINIICHLLTVKSMRAVRLGCYEMGHGCTHVATTEELRVKGCYGQTSMYAYLLVT